MQQVKRYAGATVKFIQRFNLFNYYVGGFTINMATYFCWLILPLLIKDICEDTDKASFYIGLADATTFGLCGLTCPLIGFLNSRSWFDPDVVCRIGFVLQATCGITIALLYIDYTDVLPLFFLLIQQSFALAFFWSTCEFLLSNEIYKGETNQKMSWFSSSWSLGKAIGFVLGGTMRAAFGNTFSLYFSSVIVMIAFVVFPRFPRNRSMVTRNEAKELKKISVRVDVISVMAEPEKQSNAPYYYMMYYFNELVIHFTVYGTVAVFGNQYIDFADEEQIVLNGVNDDPGLFSGVFLGCVYFSQTICFYLLGLFDLWQFKPTLNIVVQVIIGAICIALCYLRNGWVLCLIAIPIGFISGYDLQCNVYYSVSAGPKRKGIVIGLSECVGELTCCLCPLFAGLCSSASKNKRWALYFGLILQCVGIVLCLITQIAIYVLECRKKNATEEAEDKPMTNDDLEIEANAQHIEVSVDEPSADEPSAAAPPASAPKHTAAHGKEIELEPMAASSAKIDLNADSASSSSPLHSEDSHSQSPALLTDSSKQSKSSHSSSSPLSMSPSHSSLEPSDE